MFCRKCGKEIPNDASFCPFCGETVNFNGTYSEVKAEKKITFKEAVAIIFNRIFVFNGRTGQREFNYGFLFLIIICSILSMILIMPESQRLAGEILANGLNDATMNDYLNSFISKDILHFSNIYSVGAAIIYSVFLVAPVFRRMIDTGKSKQVAMMCAILFVVSELACSNILFCLLPDGVYSNIVFVLDLLSVVNLVIILMCVFGKSKEIY